MAIYLRGDTWHYDFRYKCRRYRGTTGQKDKKKAEEIECQVRANLLGNATAKQVVAQSLRLLDDGRGFSGFPIDGEKMFEFYIKNSPQKNERLLKKSLYEWETWCKDHKKTNFLEITSKVANAYLEHLRSLSFSDNTIALRVRHVASLMGMLYRHEYVVENPFSRIRLGKVVKRAYDAYTPEELDRINSMATGMNYVIYCVAICTGLRFSDICALRKEHINLKENFLKLKTKKTGSVVKIPLLPKLKTLIEEHLAKDTDSPYLFPELFLEPQKYRREFTLFLQGIGINPFEEQTATNGHTYKATIKGVHSFRHTFVYLAAKNGIPMPLVQAIVGHASEKMTEYYAQHATFDDIKEQMFQKLPDFMKESKSSTNIESQGETPRQKLIEAIDNLAISEIDREIILDLINQI